MYLLLKVRFVFVPFISPNPSQLRMRLAAVLIFCIDHRQPVVLGVSNISLLLIGSFRTNQIYRWLQIGPIV